MVDTTFSIVYRPMYWSINFFTGLSLNTKFLVLNNTLSPFFQSSVFFLSLSACLFISSCTFFNTTPASSCTFFIFSANSVAFSIFPLFLYYPSFSILFHSLLWKIKPWLLCELCCLLQTLLIPTTLASPSAYDLQRISSTVPTLGSSIPSAHLFVDGTPSTTLFLFLTFHSTLLSTLLQTVVFYLTLHSLAIHVTSIRYFWTVLLSSLLISLLLLPQNVPFLITYHRPLG